MNQSQITAIQERLDVLDKIDIQDKVSVFYKDQANFENSMLSTMTISDFCLSYTDAITKLSNALKTKKSPFLPYNYNFHNEYAHGNLPALLDQILGYINGNDFANAQIQISNLIHYEILNGIFDEPKYPKNSLRIEKINDTEEKLSLLQKQLNMYSKNIESQLDLLTKKSSEIESFIASKNVELAEVANLLSNATGQYEKIVEIHNNSTKHGTQIEAFSVQHEKLLDNSETLLKEQKEGYAEYNTTQDDYLEKANINISNIEMQIKKFEDKLEFVESKKEFFEERIEYLEELIGKEVGVNLFQSFKQRKDELDSSVSFWKWAIPVVALFTVFAVFAFFTNFWGKIGEVPDEFTLQFYISTSLKLAPFFVLLYFSISQYTKERNYQEEYAFKSAVALTINAYRERVGNEDRKDDLVIDSVMNIFQSPIKDNISGIEYIKKTTNIISEFSKIIQSMKDFTVKKNQKAEE